MTMPTPAIDQGRLVTASTNFGFNLFAEIVKQDFGQNIFISPFSVGSALAMVYNGAGGETQKAIAATLALPGMGLDEVNRAHAALKQASKGSDFGEWEEEIGYLDFRLVIANSLWARKGATFKPGFIHNCRSVYGAEAVELDRSDQAAVETINAWVSKKTQQKILRIVERVDPAAVLLIINAVYLKGLWTYQFDEMATQERVFTLLDGNQKKHPMMSLPEPCVLPYYRGENFQAVSLPYKWERGRMSMYIFLPDEHIALPDFLGSLTAENWQAWMSGFKPAEGQIVLPRFKFEYAKSQ